MNLQTELIMRYVLLHEIFQMGIKDLNVIHIILIIIIINFDCKSVDNTYHKLVIMLLSYQCYVSHNC